jgi:purine-binding chemotaxis protein CheW
VDLLAFDLAGGRYAIPAGLVQEVARAVSVAPLPQSPSIIDGVINVRGIIVPVLDVRRRCGLDSLPLGLDQHFLIARAGRRTVALRVDRAVELLSVPDHAMEAAAQAAPGTDYVAGIVTLPDGLLVIHDLEQFLSLDESHQLDAALRHQPAPKRAAVGATA